MPTIAARAWGGRLLAHVETWLRAGGVRWLQVKTIDGSHPSAEYGQTRAFYMAKGFEPLETLPTLWGAKAPALQLLKALGTA